MTMRAIPVLMTALMFIGCAPKDVSQPSDPDDDTGGSGGGDDASVWENARHSTSREFTDAYTDGSSLYVTAGATTGDGGETWSYKDGEWEQIYISLPNNLNAIWGKGSGSSLKMVAVGDAGLLADWNGEEWEVIADSTTNFMGVDGALVTELMAVGGGKVWDNIGGTWAPQATDTDGHLNDIWFDGTTAVTVGDDGLIATYADGEWTTREEGSNHLYGVSGVNANDIWAVGSQGTVLHYNGNIWQTIDLGTRANMWDVWSPSGNVAYVVGTNGEAFRIRGNIVEELPTGVREHLLGITGTNETNIWAVGSKGMTLRYIGD
jgi:hypothetical protein